MDGKTDFYGLAKEFMDFYGWKGKTAQHEKKGRRQPVERIKTKTYTIQALASEIGMGPNKFFGVLREKGFLRRDNMPNQPYLQKGLLTIVKVAYTFSNGYTQFIPKARVTKKGMKYFKKVFGAAA